MLLEDGNNGTEVSENSDDEYLPDFTKVQSHMYEPCVLKESLRESCPGKESSDSEEDNRIRNNLWCSCGKYKSKTTHAESSSDKWGFITHLIYPTTVGVWVL